MSAAPKSLDPRVKALSVAWCINTFAYSIAYPFLPIYLHSERGFPMSQVGLMYLIMGAARMLSPPVSGWLVDRLGRRIVLMAAPFLRGVIYLILACAVYLEAGFPALGVLLFLVMFIGGFFQNASDAYVTDITPPALRPEAFSRVRVGLNMGWMAGPAVGAFLARTPFALLFAITGILCWITPVLVARTCTEPERQDRGEEETASLWSVLRGDRAFLLLMGFAFPLLIVSSQLISTLSIYAKDHVGLSGNEIGFLYTLNGLLVILFQMRVSRAMSGLHLALRVSGGAILYSVGYFSLAFSSFAWQVFLAVGVFTLGEMLVFPSLGSAASRMAPPRMVGRYMGLYGLVWGLGYSIGPFLGSLLYERIGQDPVSFWGVIVLFGLAAGACFTRLQKLEALQP